MAITEKITVALIGKDKLGKTFSKTGKQMDGWKSKLASMGKMALVAGAAFAVAIGVKAVKAAASFEKSMANVSTLVDTSVESMKEMGDKVKEIAKRTPVDIEELTTALYDVRSAGISAAAAMEVLETSAKLGVAGLGTTKEAANLLTTAINAFGLQSRSSSDVADVLFKTVKAGKTDISKLAEAFGKMAGNAKAAKVSFEDAQAATAALTALTGKTSEAQNALAQTFLELTQTGGKLDKGLQKQGSSLVELNKRIGEEGLVGGMKGLQKELGLTETEFKNLFSSAEGGTSVYQLLTDAYDLNAAALDDMLNGSNKMQEGFEKQTETAEMQYQILKNQLSIVMINLADKVLPYITDAMMHFSSALTITGITASAFSNKIRLVGLGLAYFVAQVIEAEDVQRELEIAIGDLDDDFDKLGERWANLDAQMKVTKEAFENGEQAMAMFGDSAEETGEKTEGVFDKMISGLMKLQDRFWGMTDEETSALQKSIDINQKKLDIWEKMSWAQKQMQGVSALDILAAKEEIIRAKRRMEGIELEKTPNSVADIISGASGLRGQLTGLAGGLGGTFTKQPIFSPVTTTPQEVVQSFNFNFSGAFIGNVGEFKKEVIDLINKDSELKSLGGV